MALLTASGTATTRCALCVSAGCVPSLLHACAVVHSSRAAPTPPLPSPSRTITPSMHTHDPCTHTHTRAPQDFGRGMFRKAADFEVDDMILERLGKKSFSYAR